MAAPWQSESAFQSQVVKAMRLHGWLVYHTWNSERSEPGFPDLFALKGPRPLVAELKRDGQEPTLAQVGWLAAFQHAGIEAYLWKPTDWSEIELVLAGQVRRQFVAPGDEAQRQGAFLSATPEQARRILAQWNQR